MRHKKIVYLPVKQGQSSKILICDNSEAIRVKERKGHFFTTKELNEYTADIIKQTLETAAEKVKTKLRDDYMELHINDDWTEIDKQSITNTFEETFKKFKV